MNGAREYSGFFREGQYGRLYIMPGSHARGYTLHIWVLPEGVSVKPGQSIWEVKPVEVYGITGGQPGWTECYGWLHRGPWEADFHKLFEQRKAEIAEEKRIAAEQDAELIAKEKARELALLSTYR